MTARLDDRYVSSQGPAPRISATLIVRNEAAVIADCLRALAPVTDEIVVVDTGSRNATRQIALDYGARVFDFPWRNDFAAARNYALDRAIGDWALYIDADERVRGTNGPTLRAQLDDPGLVACKCVSTRAPVSPPIRNIVCSGLTTASVSPARSTKP